MGGMCSSDAAVEGGDPMPRRHNKARGEGPGSNLETVVESAHEATGGREPDNSAVALVPQDSARPGDDDDDADSADGEALSARSDSWQGSTKAMESPRLMVEDPTGAPALAWNPDEHAMGSTTPPPSGTGSGKSSPFAARIRRRSSTATTRPSPLNPSGSKAMVEAPSLRRPRAYSAGAATPPREADEVSQASSARGGRESNNFLSADASTLTSRGQSFRRTGSGRSASVAGGKPKAARVADLNKKSGVFRTLSERSLWTTFINSNKTRPKLDGYSAEDVASEPEIMRAFEDETLMGRNLADTARLFCESNGQILFGTPDQLRVRIQDGDWLFPVDDDGSSYSQVLHFLFEIVDAQTPLELILREPHGAMASYDPFDFMGELGDGVSYAPIALNPTEAAFHSVFRSRKRERCGTAELELAGLGGAADNPGAAAAAAGAKTGAGKAGAGGSGRHSLDSGESTTDLAAQSERWERLRYHFSTEYYGDHSSKHHWHVRRRVYVCVGKATHVVLERLMESCSNLASTLVVGIDYPPAASEDENDEEASDSRHTSRNTSTDSRAGSALRQWGEPRGLTEPEYRAAFADLSQIFFGARLVNVDHPETIPNVKQRRLKQVVRPKLFCSFGGIVGGEDVETSGTVERSYDCPSVNSAASNKTEQMGHRFFLVLPFLWAGIRYHFDISGLPRYVRPGTNIPLVLSMIADDLSHHFEAEMEARIELAGAGVTYGIFMTDVVLADGEEHGPRVVGVFTLPFNLES